MLIFVKPRIVLISFTNKRPSSAKKKSTRAIPAQPRTLRGPEEKFRRLVAELKRLALKKGYSQEQIAPEIGVTKMTVNHWYTGYSLTAKRESIERLKTFLATH
jgi:DNA-binding XRE family transcriptional regulator